jgi:hypothetical protein
MAKMSVTIKIKKRLTLYVKVLQILYSLKLYKVADHLYYKLMERIEKDVKKFITVE